MSRFDAFLASPLAERVPLPRAGLDEALRRGFEACGHGDLDGWLAAIDALPYPARSTVSLDRDAVTVADEDIDPAAIAGPLAALSPWRKGPFDLCGIHVDCEWQSWMKWNRLAATIDWTGRTVLDVGSGNGYYGWRMLGAGAEAVVGVDPTPLYVAQFLALQRLVGASLPNWVLPLRAEDLSGPGDFDVVMSLGVLYHQRAPLQHLVDLRRWARPGGRVVVETLVVPGTTDTVLTPRERYARMRNVWHIPAADALLRWMTRAGLRDVRLVDMSVTTTDEQRRTEWMPFHSLGDFLDPHDPTRTVEGYPGPRRAIAMAVR